jgi:hypothetical protein
MSFTRQGYPAVRLIEGAEDPNRQDSRRDLINDIRPDYLITNINVMLAYLLGRSEGAPSPQNITISGTQVSWSAVPGAQYYWVMQRQPGQNAYSVFVTTAETSIILPNNTIFAIGTVGANGIMGSLSAEQFVQ